MRATQILIEMMKKERELANRRIRETMEEEVDNEEAAQANLIPKNFALKSKINGKFLRCLFNREDEDLNGFLKFSGHRVVSPYAKFTIEDSVGWKGLVHIKCRYNNKYWVLQSKDSSYIVATADEPDEDPLNWSCTLFEVIYDEVNEAFRFDHVNLNRMLFQDIKDGSKYSSCLYAMESKSSHYGITTAVDYDSIFILPKHVAFKSNNDEYLKVAGANYLQFSGPDIKDPSISHEILQANDGYIRIRGDQSGKFLVHDGNDYHWVKSKSSDAKSNDPHSCFWPVKVNNKTLALRNMGNNRFCRRLTDDGKKSCLNAGVSTITEEARIEVVEISIARSIQNIQYRLKDARVYDKKVVSMAKIDAINKSKGTVTIALKFYYEDKQKKDWSNSIGVNVGVTTKFEAGIPIVGSGKVELSAEVGAGYKWGETEKLKKVTEFVETVTVPPMSRVKINGVINEGSCDVPFSYDQTDTLRDGKQVTHHYDDGVFSGINSHGYQFKTENLPIIS